MRPALCAYCRRPAGPYYITQDNKIFGACSLEHMKKIREGERLKRVAITCDDGIEYTLNQTKQTYKELATNNGTYILHNWDRQDRKLLFAKIVNSYMTWANEQAATGKFERVIEDGHQ